MRLQVHKYTTNTIKLLDIALHFPGLVLEKNPEMQQHLNLQKEKKHLGLEQKIHQAR